MLRIYSAPLYLSLADPPQTIIFHQTLPFIYADTPTQYAHKQGLLGYKKHVYRNVEKLNKCVNPAEIVRNPSFQK